MDILLELCYETISKFMFLFYFVLKHQKGSMLKSSIYKSVHGKLKKRIKG